MASRADFGWIIASSKIQQPNSQTPQPSTTTRMGGLPSANRHQIKIAHNPSKNKIVAKELHTPSFRSTIVFIADTHPHPPVPAPGCNSKNSGARPPFVVKCPPLLNRSKNLNALVLCLKKLDLSESDAWAPTWPAASKTRVTPSPPSTIRAAKSPGKLPPNSAPNLAKMLPKSPNFPTSSSPSSAMTKRCTTFFPKPTKAF